MGDGQVGFLRQPRGRLGGDAFRDLRDPRGPVRDEGAGLVGEAFRGCFRQFDEISTTTTTTLRACGVAAVAARGRAGGGGI
jgi:hypothetical protein